LEGITNVLLFGNDNLSVLKYEIRFKIEFPLIEFYFEMFAYFKMSFSQQ